MGIDWVFNFFWLGLQLFTRYWDRSMRLKMMESCRFGQFWRQIWTKEIGGTQWQFQRPNTGKSQNVTKALEIWDINTLLPGAGIHLPSWKPLELQVSTLCAWKSRWWTVDDLFANSRARSYVPRTRLLQKTWIVFQVLFFNIFHALR